MLLREVVRRPASPLLKDIILAVAPIYNADGNERVSKTNRPGQVGPEEGMGQRPNARGLDLNRDFVKLEAPETRGLVKFLNEWNPHLFIDTHTTNGSYHRYTITYDGPKNPAGDPKVIGLHATDVLPRGHQATSRNGPASRRIYYGNFDREHTKWTSYPGRAPVWHDLCRPEEPALGPLRGLLLRPLQDAGAGDPRLRARLPGDRRRPQGRDRQAAGPGAGDRRGPAGARTGGDPVAHEGGQGAGDGPRI